MSFSRVIQTAGLGLLAVPVSLVFCSGRAEAILRYYIFDSPSTGLAKVRALGSLDLPELGSSPASPQPSIAGLCSGGSDGSLDTVSGTAINICVGNVIGPYKIYTIALSGSLGSFTGTSSAGGLSSLGVSTALSSESDYFAISSSYSSGGLIKTTTSFTQSLSGLGFTGATGLIGTYNILDSSDNPVDTVEVYFRTNPDPAPAPLPLLGGSIAMAWSRLLRRRLKAKQ